LSQNWVAIWGEFDNRTNGVVFKGRSEVLESGEKGSEEFAATGLALIKERFSNGTISATIEAAQVDHETGCELVVYYNPNTRFLICAGLGGYNYGMFSIRHFDGSRWIKHEDSGERVNFHVKKKYRVKVGCLGLASL
jgi:hypothetical protein